MPKENQTNISFIDDLNYDISKLKFLAESIACWDDNVGDFTQDLRINLSCIMQDTIKSIEENAKQLKHS